MTTQHKLCRFQPRFFVQGKPMRPQVFAGLKPLFEHIETVLNLLNFLKKLFNTTALW